MSDRVYALDPALDVQQYSHTAWRLREGFGRGWIHSITQTPDGYLWLGTQFGLLRFDGVRVSAWQPPQGQVLPGTLVMNLLTARNGRLWIALGGGLASWLDGSLTNYQQFDGWSMYGLREDREGTVWVTARSAQSRAAICAIRGEKIHCDGADGRLGDWLGALYPDSAGRLWVAARDGVWRWYPGTPEFFAVPGTLDSVQSLSEDDDGALLVATRSGMIRVKDGKVSAFPFALAPKETRSIRMLRDRHGSLWVGSAEDGISHLHQGRVDVFGKADGLTSEYVGRIFEDREGSIWVSTREGLDRFRELPIPTFGKNQGLSDNSTGAVLVTRDGSVWISTAVGLDRWRDGTFGHHQVRGMPNASGTLFEDRRGRLWIGASSQVGYLESGHWTQAKVVPAGYIDGISEDPSGNIWLAHRTQGLLRISPDGRLSRWDWLALGRDDFAGRMAVDPRDGGIWLGFLHGGVAHVVDGRVDIKYSDADGLGKGRIYFMRVDPDGTLWVGSAGGLSRIRKSRIVNLDHGSGLPCSPVRWMIDDGAGDTWINTACGLMRVSRRELDDSLAAAERGKPTHTLKGAVFSDSDGVRSGEMVSSFDPQVGRAPDGRLWFAASDGVGVVDPRHLARNTLAPPVHIVGLVANRVSYDPALPSALKLPALIRDLRIDYTALSLVAPEKMQFRYRLVGRDRNWQDVGNRREAYYSDLAPGDYRFQVIASNNDGVWNDRGASLAFTIPPTFYQSRWFLAACVAAVLLVLWLLYALRVRQIESRVQLRLEEREAERERIARELHDTFMQSVQGLILKFHAAMLRLPPDVPSRHLMEQALEKADAVVTEGRDRVYALRDSSQAVDLPQALVAVAEEFSQVAEAEFRVTVQGTARTLHPLVREEAFRIGAEALINAFRHAHARHVDLEIEYSRKELCLRVTDDGRGFDVNNFNATPKRRHFGLQGLHERARELRAQVQVSSRIGSGSAVELRIPGSIAYAAARDTRSLLPD